ncbi:MAG: DUF1016 family protein [Bacteroidetes bacterium]|nr:DUF1016 family protein [Bacteroidota bacterium]
MKFTKQFSEVVKLAQSARTNAFKSINAELVNLYWQIGEYISRKVDSEEWGMNVVDNLAEFMEVKCPDLKGFDRRGLYRMKQFYESYKNATLLDNTDVEKVSPLVTQLPKTVKSGKKNGRTQGLKKVSPLVTQITTGSLSSIKSTVLARITWSNHLLLLSKATSIEERVFYLYLSIKENYSKRELERQLDSGYYERVMLSKKKIAPQLSKLRDDIHTIFKDNYIFEFAGLPQLFSEKDLQKSLVENLKFLLLELGKDFSFIGEEFKIKVGGTDYFIDLLFYHRELQCLVAFDLKITDFKPEYLGKINFYLEALDRDVKKKHENPSVGISLCKSKDDEVVQYALNRSLSPTMIARYNTKLINKKLLKQKVHELFERLDLSQSSKNGKSIAVLTSYEKSVRKAPIKIPNKLSKTK